MLRKSLMAVLVAGLMVAGTGCGMFSKQDESQADTAKEKKEPEVEKITFGDLPSDDGVKGVLNERGHFGKDEDFALRYDLPKGQTFDTTRIKVKIIKEKGNRLLQEWNHEVEPDWKGHRWEFTDDMDFNGFYETGKYKLQIYRGKELLAEGKFEIVD
ncbi:hypothetical protein [Paludifilum halophilum]|uniref:Uncharacterized protein n=1 Tax=Paludifilum halophilum TaxID=1642702 RepID=A0A235B9E1_9BACL|nr:hypothetical protein [Paludifilum halophilum]OYD08881.1 hypothetical protein CHM34_03610 [Paludifilum halophilum]